MGAGRTDDAPHQVAPDAMHNTVVQIPDSFSHIGDDVIPVSNIIAEQPVHQIPRISPKSAEKSAENETDEPKRQRRHGEFDPDTAMEDVKPITYDKKEAVSESDSAPAPQAPHDGGVQKVQLADDKRKHYEACFDCLTKELRALRVNAPNGCTLDANNTLEDMEALCKVMTSEGIDRIDIYQFKWDFWHVSRRKRYLTNAIEYYEKKLS